MQSRIKTIWLSAKQALPMWLPLALMIFFLGIVEAFGSVASISLVQILLLFSLALQCCCLVVLSQIRRTLADMRFSFSSQPHD